MLKSCSAAPYLTLVAWMMTVFACSGTFEQAAANKTGGNPRRGIRAIRNYNCARCHTIPGVAGAEGRTGPSFDQFSVRQTIAGNIPNTPENLIRWIQNPASLDQFASMPNQGVTPNDAKDMAAYLYTLR